MSTLISPGQIDALVCLPRDYRLSPSLTYVTYLAAIDLLLVSTFGCVVIRCFAFRGTAESS
jgi:hypothetical protein